MRKNILLFIMIFCFAFSFAQDSPMLGINGLHMVKKVAKMDISSAELVTVNSTSGRTSGQNQVYRIVRNVDSNSTAIEAAANTGKSFPKAYVKLTVNGGAITKELITVYISNYTIAQQGTNATETFWVHFSSVSEGR